MVTTAPIDTFPFRRVVLDYRLRMPADAAPAARIDTWFATVFGIDPDGFATAPAIDRGDIAAGLAGRIAVLVRYLLVQQRVPVFDAPALLSLTPAEAQGEIVARAGFAAIDGIDPDTWRRTLSACAALVAWMAGNEVSDAARARLLDEMDRNVVAPGLATSPIGKSTMPVLQTAHDMGIPFCHLGAGIFQLGQGSKARRIDRSTTDRDTAMGFRLSQNKVVAASLLRMAGLPAPVHVVAASAAEARAAAERLGYPLVVKPADRDRGEGVTVDVADPGQLAAAFAMASAAASGGEAVVERQVAGLCFRLFVANGGLLYAVARLPMSVEGDGVRSVADLVAAELAAQQALPPWKRSEIRPLDSLALAAMAREGFAPDSVPAAGVRVPLRRIESTEWGGLSDDVTERVHPANAAAAIRAAELFGLSTAGIDIITEDIGVPWHDSGAIINEVNFSPLFGTGPVSLARVPAFLAALMGGDGRIPIERFWGSEAMREAQTRRAELAASGLRCFLASQERVLDAGGEPVAMPLRRLDGRVRALLLRPDVDAIVAVHDEPGR